MKKLFLFIGFTLFLNAAFAQRYPINNLQFNQWYVTPYNCYTLSWMPPDSSLTDTLLGYNIYRDNNFYRFTTTTSQQCIPCMGDTSTAFCGSFMQYNNGHFYIHVTAVYNSAQDESNYADSAEFQGLAIGLNEMEPDEDISVAPNPFISSTTLYSNRSFGNASITIVNSMGQCVREMKHLDGQSFNLERQDLNSGIYTLKFVGSNDWFIERKLVVIN